MHSFIDSLSLFGIGASWGGYESLVIPFDTDICRTVTRRTPNGPMMRFHIGLEDVDDLIADLERGFAVMAAV
jgi:cystathionine beta-lyase